MERYTRWQRTRKWTNCLLEAIALPGNGFLPMLTALAIEGTDRQTGNSMYTLSSKSGLLQGVLNNCSVQTRPRVALKMRGRTVQGTNRIHGILCLVLRDALFGLMDPGHTGLAHAST